MAGRALWILAAGAALVGGLIYRDRVGVEWGDHGDRTVIIDRNGERNPRIEPATAKALAAAVGRQVRAETRLATMEAVGNPSTEELAAAEAEVARAEAEVERLEAEIERQRQSADRSVTREENR